jgi:hypothetical protein
MDTSLTYIALVWILIHGSQAYLIWKSHNEVTLPFASLRGSRTQWTSTFRWRRSELIIKPFHLRASSTALSYLKPNSLSAGWPRRRAAWMVHLYNVGVLAGVLGQLAALGLTFFTILQLISKATGIRPFLLASSNSPPSTLSLQRRGVEFTDLNVATPSQNSRAMVLQPIVCQISFAWYCVRSHIHITDPGGNCANVSHLAHLRSAVGGASNTRSRPLCHSCIVSSLYSE